MGTWLHYQLFGLEIRSEIELPELTPLAHRDVASVEIRRGPVSGFGEAASAGPTGVEIAEHEFLLRVEGIAAYRASRGQTITVDAAPGATPAAVRAYLLSSVIGTLCHQRRLLPLHACTVEIDGRCVAFAGDSGAGKSTLAAYFHARGYRILGDDLCVLTLPEAGPPLAWPGLPRIKLWRDSLDALGHEPVDPVIAGMDKYHVQWSAAAEHDPLPLSRLYIIDAEVHAATEVSRLGGRLAMNALLANTYRPHLLAQMGRLHEQFERCLRLVPQLPVFAVARRRSFEAFAEEMAMLEDHVRLLRP